MSTQPKKPKDPKEKSKDKQESKTLPGLLIFGDIHDCPETYKVLTHSLAHLKQKGYDTIYYETPSQSDELEGVDIEKLIMLFKEKVEIAEIFPAGWPKNFTQSQRAFIDKLLPNLGNIQNVFNYITHCSSRGKWSSQAATLFEIVKKLDMRVILIDMPNPEGQGYEARNNFMHKKIIAGISRHRSNGIVIVGLDHMVDIYGKNLGQIEYIPGLISRMRQQSKDAVQIQQAFVFYPPDQSFVILDKIKLCTPGVIQTIYGRTLTLDSINNETGIKYLVSTRLLVEREFMPGKYQYVIPLPFLKGSIDGMGVKKITHYISDLGGSCEQLQALASIKITLPFALDTQPIQMLRDLGLGRLNVNQDALNLDNIEFLRENFPLLQLKERMCEGEEQPFYQLIYPLTIEKTLKDTLEEMMQANKARFDTAITHPASLFFNSVKREAAIVAAENELLRDGYDRARMHPASLPNKSL